MKLLLLAAVTGAAIVVGIALGAAGWHRGDSETR